MGPGKAALLEAIITQKSISASARALGMSYRRTWLLVDTMNRCWRSPLIETAAGGARGGGATLTALGTEVLAHYKALAAAIDQASQGELMEALTARIRQTPLTAQLAQTSRA